MHDVNCSKHRARDNRLSDWLIGGMHLCTGGTETTARGISTGEPPVNSKQSGGMPRPRSRLWHQHGTSAGEADSLQNAVNAFAVCHSPLPSIPSFLPSFLPSFCLPRFLPSIPFYLFPFLPPVLPSVAICNFCPLLHAMLLCAAYPLFAQPCALVSLADMPVCTSFFPLLQA